MLPETANVRTDAYGGSIENRARLLIEGMAAVADEIGAYCIGVRLLQVSPASGIVPASDEQLHFDYAVTALDEIGIPDIHVTERATGGRRDALPFDYDALRQRFRNA